MIIADLECNLEKISSYQPSDKNSYTEKYQKHTACSFGYKVVCHYDMKYSKDLVIYRGSDPIGEFLTCMKEEVQNCQEVIKTHFNRKIKMNEEDEKFWEGCSLPYLSEKIQA